VTASRSPAARSSNRVTAATPPGSRRTHTWVYPTGGPSFHDSEASRVAVRGGGGRVAPAMTQWVGDRSDTLGGRARCSLRLFLFSSCFVRTVKVCLRTWPLLASVHLLVPRSKEGDADAWQQLLPARDPCRGSASATHTPYKPRLIGNGTDALRVRGSVPAQWCISCVHAQTRFSCKKLRNPLLKAPRKEVDLWKNCRGTAREATRVGGWHFTGWPTGWCRYNLQLSRATRSQSPWRQRVSVIQSSINIDRVTACVAVVGQLHRLLTAGRLSMPTA